MRGPALLSGDCLSLGGFAGATLAKRQLGGGHGHNTFMLENVETHGDRGPVRPFPRNLLSRGGMTFYVPRPPWFVSKQASSIISRSFADRGSAQPSWFQAAA